MGVHPNIGFKGFPKQGAHLNKGVVVCFNYDLANTIPGVVVRDDSEEPFRTIIELADGRFVEASECQYSIPAAGRDAHGKG
jgi:hypothetical protein